MTLEEMRAWASSRPAARLAAVCLVIDAAAKKHAPPAPREPIHVFWEAPSTSREGFVTMCGRGVAMTLDGNGDVRFHDIARDGRSALAQVDVLADARPRFFGGFSFDVGACDSAWDGFTDASFVLPARLVEIDGSHVRITVIRPASVIAEPGFLESEAQLHEDEVRIADESNAVLRHGRTDGEAKAEIRDDAYVAITTRALDAIRAGSLEKVVLARRSRIAWTRRVPWDVVLRRIYRAPRTTRFAFSRGPRVFIGATPETLAITEGRVVSTEAVAGTAARRGFDEAEVVALLASEKDQREHAFVRDALVGALAPFVEETSIGGVHVRSTVGVHHLVSTVTAVRKGSGHIVELAGALHPTPAVAGSPRDAARGFIRVNEGWSRGWYASPVGWFDREGDGAFVVAIRSALLDDGGAWVFAGAGVVRGSHPELELAETQAKQAPMLSALRSQP